MLPFVYGGRPPRKAPRGGLFPLRSLAGMFPLSSLASAERTNP